MPDLQKIQDKSSYALNVLRDSIAQARIACRSKNIEESLGRNFEGALNLHISHLWYEIEESKKKEIEQYNAEWDTQGLRLSGSVPNAAA